MFWCLIALVFFLSLGWFVIMAQSVKKTLSVNPYRTSGDTIIPPPTRESLFRIKFVLDEETSGEQPFRIVPGPNRWIEQGR